MNGDVKPSWVDLRAWLHHGRGRRWGGRSVVAGEGFQCRCAPRWWPRCSPSCSRTCQGKQGKMFHQTGGEPFLQQAQRPHLQHRTSTMGSKKNSRREIKTESMDR